MIGCLKGFASIGGILILAVGIGILIVSLYTLITDKIPYQATNQSKKSIYITLILVDLFVIAGGLLGIIGIKKGNLCCMCIFQIFVVVFCVIFVIIGSIAVVLPKLGFSGDCKSSPDNEFIASANYATLKSQLLCLPICPCGLTDQAINSSSYNNIEKQLLYMSATRAPDQPIAFQDCAVAKIAENYTIIDAYTVLGAVENVFECSGWCGNTTLPFSLIYHFSNVNNGKPKYNGCYDQLKDGVEKYGRIVAWGTFAIAAIMFLVFLVNICICCHPERSNLPIRERFVYFYQNNNQPQYQRI